MREQRDKERAAIKKEIEKELETKGSSSTNDLIQQAAVFARLVSPPSHPYMPQLPYYGNGAAPERYTNFNRS
jgi:hypothetical protein